MEKLKVNKLQKGDTIGFLIPSFANKVDKFKKIESRKYVTADFLDDYDDDEYSKFRYYEENNPLSIVVEPRSITTFVIQL